MNAEADIEKYAGKSKIDGALAIPRRPEPAPDALVEAIRAELRACVDQGSFGIAALTTIEALARTGKQLLQAREGHAGAGKPFGGLVKGGTDDAMMGSSPYYSVGDAGETFGTTALRELGAMLKRTKDKSRSRATIIRELAIARDEGLDDVAAELKQELDDLRNVDKRLAGQAEGAVTALAQFDSGAGAEEGGAP